MIDHVLSFLTRPLGPTGLSAPLWSWLLVLSGIAMCVMLFLAREPQEPRGFEVRRKDAK